MAEERPERRPVIRVQRVEETSEARPPRPERRADIRSIGLAVAVLGGALSAFGPLLRWWKQTLPAAGITVGTVGGLAAWTGVVALIGGIGTLSLGAVSSSKPAIDARLGYAMLASGLVTFGAALLSLVSGQRILGTELPVEAEPGLYLTLAGGALAAIGGYLQTREGPAR